MTTDPHEENQMNGPGCGMGLYAMLLLFICLLGLVGMIGGTIGLLNSEPEEARNLVHGSEVQTWRLQPMRNAKLLELTEVPGAWHDESPRFDGTTACVVRLQSVGKIEDETVTELKWAEIERTSVERSESDQMSITVHGADSAFTCHFGPNEGADRFLRQVESEMKKAKALTPATEPPDPEPQSADR